MTRSKPKKGSIYDLNVIEKNKTDIFKMNNIIPILNSKDEIEKFKRTNIKFGIHSHTGINRLGLENTKMIINLLIALKWESCILKFPTQLEKK